MASVYDASQNKDFWSTRPVPVVARCITIGAAQALCRERLGTWRPGRRSAQGGWRPKRTAAAA
jgi:hypothetical protein